MRKIDKLKNIEEANKRLLGEGEETISSTELGQKTKDTGMELKKGGLAPKERETLNQAIEMLTAFFKQPGNQATGKAFNLFNKLKSELQNVKPQDEKDTYFNSSISGGEEE